MRVDALSPLPGFCASEKQMKISIIDFDGKLPNLALMKISTFYKKQGAKIYFGNVPKDADKVYCSVLFSWNKDKAAVLKDYYENIEFGGTGWNIKKTLPEEIERCTPDYDLYPLEEIYRRTCGGIGKKSTKLKKAMIIKNMGLGFTSRGCCRKCHFCLVPRKEGKLRQVAEVKDIINPGSGSNVVTLLDNNLTADPYALDKLKEIKDLGLTVDISQGIDIRLINEDLARALSEVRHLRSLHYAWDLPDHEESVINGINLLSRFIKTRRHMCFMLVGFNSSFEEDMYRFRRLVELKVDPYIMVYNKKPDIRLKHFARWVNGRIYKKCSWDEYEPWIKAQQQEQLLFA